MAEQTRLPHKVLLNGDKLIIMTNEDSRYPSSSAMLGHALHVHSNPARAACQSLSTGGNKLSRDVKHTCSITQPRVSHAKCTLHHPASPACDRREEPPAKSSSLARHSPLGLLYHNIADTTETRHSIRVAVWLAEWS